ncbi:4-hydroxythreonine-4-phosphate dehydrogenase PdxA [Hydrogenophaga sp.]|uniref:PdxA family dehydrogenase n=1 Tax=Hydrogenophaga sp. TaxID=1904254 RepID=UPI0025BF8DE7|nr:4-hydroxythreonine-4-phosphate dehydrogenase PdxA [Hydrogenophaga sp.]
MKRIALTVGDPNGIGPEIALKSLAALSPAQRAQITLFGPEPVLARTAQTLNLQALLAEVAVVPVGHLPDAAHRPGEVCAEAGHSAVVSASAAIEACCAGGFDAVVAGPHHETAIARAGIAFNGYPGLVARVSGVPEDAVFLMLVGAGLRIVHATLHESVEHALQRLTPALVVAAATAGLRACTAMGIARPRAALFGINPHASEGELFGPHDRRCTRPAAARLRELGHDVADPQGADVLLADRATRPFDLYVAMLHDQGHIPVKLLAPQGASALSIGARVLLASTGHGSAMDIAGTGRARPDAMLRSLQLVGGWSDFSSSHASP